MDYDREGRRSRDYFPHLDTHYRNFEYSVMDNRLQKAGNNLFTHDKNGFRSIWNHGGQYTLYEYGTDYRLLKAEKRETGEVFEFSHDDQGRRAIKSRNGQPVEAYQWLDFLRLDGFHDGKSGYRFAYRAGERTPYAMQRDDGAEAYLFYDHIGSLRVVADRDGDVIKEILYDPFGGIMKDTTPDLRIPIGFAGGLYDPDLGFVRFGWRDYDTFTDRWTAPDPLGDQGGDPDWYGYCFDDPVNGNDPLGLETRGIGGGLSASGFGLGIGGNAMISEDDDGERVYELSFEHGTTNDFGFGAVGTYQKTNAESVDQLSGKSTRIGGAVAIPTPIGAVGGGIEHIKGDGYTGKNFNISWSPKLKIELPTKKVTGAITHEKTMTIKVPKIKREYEPDLW
ncbi:RHS repeat domain-containing protein [Pseudodesulfovibrio sp.]|uniref:RHS repeat domain-containing protein n=1 Tax=unclassified Pseudodesulfovibrio TaxID=2661612 RepID=UPI003B003B07